MVFVTEIRALIGVPPAGMEWLEYTIVSILLLWLLNGCVSILAGIFRLIGGGR